MIHTVALILAGGVGDRMQNNVPKQFLEIEGLPVVVRTISAFASHPGVDAVAVVCLSDWRDFVQTAIAKIGMTKPLWLFEGGDTAYESLCRGIEGLRQKGCDGDTVTLVHDSVRPLVSQEIISGNIDVCRRCGNAITAIRSEEAFGRSSDGYVSNGYMAREGWYRIQTPHTFRLGDVVSACRRVSGTKPQSLYTLMAEQEGIVLHMTPGESRNFKLTYPDDVFIYQAIIKQEAGSL